MIDEHLASYKSFTQRMVTQTALTSLLSISILSLVNQTIEITLGKNSTLLSTIMLIMIACGGLWIVNKNGDSKDNKAEKEKT